MFCHGAGLRPGRLQGIAASFSVCGPDTPLPEERSPRAHNARPAAHPRARSGGAVPSTVDVMFCHVPLPWRPFLHCVSFPPRSRPPGRGADPDSRVSRARLRPGPGARFAPARFAHLIARARGRRRTHVSRRFLRIFFSPRLAITETDTRLSSISDRCAQERMERALAGLPPRSSFGAGRTAAPTTAVHLRTLRAERAT